MQASQRRAHRSARWKHADHTGAADLLGHLEAGFLELLRQASGGVHFERREFGVGMQVLVEFHQVRNFGGDLGIDGVAVLCDGRLRRPNYTSPVTS